MFDAILTMLQMQDRMNRRVHPQWIEQNFAWHRAIWVECAELLDHHGYKWWKRQEPDWPQVQLEVIDIWHFGMSSRFSPELTNADIARELEEELSTGVEAMSLAEAVEDLAGIAASEQRFCGRAFATLMRASDIDFPELYRQYLGKNVLNFFRQDNGYKDGSYRKLWDGREDNEHLMELLPDIDTQSQDADRQLYRALADRYTTTS